MRITKLNGVYKASRITGPKHNYLGLRMSAAPMINAAIEARMLVNEPAVIDETQLIAAVTAGIDHGNRAKRKVLYAHMIEYVPSDTPDYGVYSELARAITEAASNDFA